MLDWRNNHSKIEPRDADNLLVMPKVAALSPAEAITAAGSRQVTFSVQLDNPHSDQLTVAIDAQPAELWDTPVTSVSIPAGARSAAFTLITAATVDAAVTGGSVGVVLFGGTSDGPVRLRR